MTSRRPPTPKGVKRDGVVHLEEAEVGVHLGNILMDHLADKYPSLMLTLLEGVPQAGSQILMSLG